MKSVLGMLALLAMAGMATATLTPWYHQTMYKWRCFVPGCDQCVEYNPYQCETCSAGYTLLKDFTCGCAPGYGSYVQPPMSGYPWYPPQSCPTWVKSSTGVILKGTVRTTLANGRASKPIELKTFYASKPDFCCQTYYPTKTCQGYIPVASVGYCQCFACPAGTNSVGGPINSQSAGCTPGSAPVTRCKNAPPQIENAKPWNPTKCLNLKPGKACKTTCNTGFVSEPENTTLVAACTTGGIWKTSGACVSAAAGCKGKPKAGENAEPFNDDCEDGDATATCTATCKPGFEGEATATCDAATGEWVVESTCTAVAGICAGAPDVPGATFLDDCVDGEPGATCDGSCDNGSPITVTCSNEGQWVAEGTCSAEPACPGAPELPADSNANEFLNQNGDPCADGAVNDACQASCVEGFEGGIDAICLADGGGWDVSGECVEAGGGGGADIVCEGQPEKTPDMNINDWPDCAGTPLDEVCVGSCADGFNADGSFAEAYCIDDGAGGAIWDVGNIDCIPQKRRRNRKTRSALP